MVEIASLRHESHVFVLTMHGGENRFSTQMCRQLNAALDEVEAAGSPAALVTTGTGKFYSNGLDLDEMIAAGESYPDKAATHLRAVLDVMARVLTFPAITVAAVNGHAFGAGAQIAVAHDYRVMRADRGFFCMPEIDMRAPLHPFMTELLRERLPPLTAHEVIVTGRRYGGSDAAAAGIVDHAVAEDEVVEKAVAIATELTGKADPVMRTLKRELHRRALAVIGDPLPA